MTQSCIERERYKQACEGPCNCEAARRERIAKQEEAAKKKKQRPKTANLSGGGNTKVGQTGGKGGQSGQGGNQKGNKSNNKNDAKVEKQQRSASQPPPKPIPYDPDSHRLPADYYKEELYCPHVLVSNWFDERARCEGYPGVTSHKNDYCFYRKPRVPEYPTRKVLRTKNQRGYGHDFLTFPYTLQQFDPDRLSEYERTFNHYDCCERKSIQPMLDFERGLFHNSGKMQERPVYRPERIPEPPYRYYGDLGHLEHLVPHIQVECPAQEPPINADYFSTPYAMQTHWPTGTTLF